MSPEQFISAWIYPALLHLHMTLAALSVALFTARGLGVQLKQPWPMQRPWRLSSVGIDVLLLLAGSVLWWWLQHNPMREPWLATKLALLPVYVVLGSLALKRARTPGARKVFFVAALLCVGTMAWIAMTRNACPFC
jgi:uncharacterized membrane protein SirB2